MGRFRLRFVTMMVVCVGAIAFSSSSEAGPTLIAYDDPSLTEDERLAAMATEYPEFAGIWRDRSTGKVHVALTEPDRGGQSGAPRAP